MDWLSNVDLTNIKNVDRIFVEIVRLMKNELLSKKPRVDVEFARGNIKYLQRVGVQRQAKERIQSAGLTTAKVFIRAMRWDNSLPTLYMEWDVVDANGQQWNMNFWPCSTCACISFLPLKRD
jgi:hypothetical protein